MEILFQDEHYVAVVKPPGMMVHRNEFDRTGPAVIQTLRRQLGKRVYPVHRLDRATSGVMVLAFSSEACGALGAAFASQSVTKTYVAIVRGFTEEGGLIDRPIKQRETQRIQEAQTLYKTLARGSWPQPIGPFDHARFSLVAVRPLTGRRHQIRRHLRSSNHHLIGDTRWGDGRYNRYFRQHFDSHQLLLMAKELVFSHPYHREIIHLKAPLDSEFARLAARFNWAITDAEVFDWGLPSEPQPI